MEETWTEISQTRMCFIIHHGLGGESRDEQERGTLVYNYWTNQKYPCVPGDGSETWETSSLWWPREQARGRQGLLH